MAMLKNAVSIFKKQKSAFAPDWPQERGE